VLGATPLGEAKSLVETSRLFWNALPSRNPFSIQILICSFSAKIKHLTDDESVGGTPPPANSGEFSSTHANNLTSEIFLKVFQRGECVAGCLRNF